MHDRAPLVPVRREHLEAMTGRFGIYQHARGRRPDPVHGSCTDDVARAALVDLDQAAVLGAAPVRRTLWQSLWFLEAAFEPDPPRFRNFRSSSGAWLDDGGSEDCQGRALLALAQIATRCADPAARRTATELLRRALPVARELHAIRAVASALLACVTIHDPHWGTTPESPLEELGQRLSSAFAGASAEDWRWPEDAVTYESALPPRALIAAGSRLGRPGMVDLGLAALDWLLEAQVGDSGVYQPVGNRGWWQRRGSKARFDQQPIEAATVVQAAEVAFASTGDPRYLDAAESAYGWFLGRNDLGIVMADVARGGCRDGLGPNGPNENQGAESTLMWLTALEATRRLRRSRVTPPDGRTDVPESGRPVQTPGRR